MVRDGVDTIENSTSIGIFLQAQEFPSQLAVYKHWPTPLYIAAHGGHLEVVRALVEVWVWLILYIIIELVR